MTIRDALQQRIPRVRDPKWAPMAYLRLPLLEGGGVGPWAELYDDGVQQDVLEIRPGSQRVLVIHMMADSCEPYAGPVSPFEQADGNFARVYVEA
jgi:hypothetical protein